MGQETKRIRHMLDRLDTHNVLETGCICKLERIRCNELNAAMPIVRSSVLDCIDGNIDTDRLLDHVGSGKQFRTIAHTARDIKYPPVLNVLKCKLVPHQMQFERRLPGRTRS